MTKLVLNDLASLTNETTAIQSINNNYDSIVDAIENTLSRDGTSPNTMEADLDMNSKRILNLSAATGAGMPVTYEQIGGLPNTYASYNDSTRDGINLMDLIPFSERDAIINRTSTYNCAPAINDAIVTLGNRGGGKLIIPSGTFRIQPALINSISAILVNANNITIEGDEKSLSILEFRLYDGSDPKLNWPLVSGAVNRGAGVYIQSITSTRTNITFRNLTLYGSANNTSNKHFPADPVTGDGWDLTHKAIYLQQNKLHDNILIDNCDIYGWRGECVYYGGIGLNKIVTKNSKVHGSNASLLSYTSVYNDIINCELYDTANEGIECAYVGGIWNILGNYIHECESIGAALVPSAQTPPYAALTISGNTFKNNSSGLINGAGLYIVSPCNARVYDNLFIDNYYRGITTSSLSFGGSNNPALAKIVSDNTEIFHNSFISDSRQTNVSIYTGYNGLNFFSDGIDYIPRNIFIHSNQFNVTAYGLANGRIAPDFYAGGPTMTTVMTNLYPSCQIINNYKNGVKLTDYTGTYS